MKLIHIASGIIFALSLNCTPQAAKTATDVITTVADDTCKELVAQADAGNIPPDYVMLECKAEGIVSGLVKVLMARQDHAAIKARHAPGK